MDKTMIEKTMIKIQQIGSPIRRHRRQRQTLIGLGLNRIGRIALVPDTAASRGMIEKMRHLVRVVPEDPGSLKLISSRRFDALAGYIRNPASVLIFEELEWHATFDERVLGMLVRDRTDEDFGWIILGRDERLRFRAIDANSSVPDADAARANLLEQMKLQHKRPNADFYQGDARGRPMDFFTPRVRKERLHPNFRTLTEADRYSPARSLITAMMRFYEDLDGNFVEQLQTTGFDLRLWELYLYATFIELGYAPASSRAVPDFIFRGPLGSIGIEATSINPPQAGDAKPPQGEKELLAYMENYIPIRLARVLNAKLEKEDPYWEIAEMEDVPFIIAVQDFHFPGAMHMITSAMSEYVFGVRETVDENGVLRTERIEEHVWGNHRETSGFFDFPNAENISAVIINPQGTLPKFNRLGYLAEFGNRRVRMVREGMARAEPAPHHFVHTVHEPDYTEDWVEGMTVFHNPRALIALPPEMIPGANHEFLQPDGSIVSLVPPFHPLFSRTAIWVAGPKEV